MSHPQECSKLIQLISFSLYATLWLQPTALMGLFLQKAKRTSAKHYHRMQPLFYFTFG
ncbi:hypothetical protein KIPB_016346, partial [Kipferlia bialata]|eukprot:g16346.t1